MRPNAALVLALALAACGGRTTSPGGPAPPTGARAEVPGLPGALAVIGADTWRLDGTGGPAIVLDDRRAVLLAGKLLDFDLGTGRVTRSLALPDGAATAMVRAADGALLLSGSSKDEELFWEVDLAAWTATRRPLPAANAVGKANYQSRGMAVSPDGTQVIITGIHQGLVLRARATGAVIRELSPEPGWGTPEFVDAQHVVARLGDRVAVFTTDGAKVREAEGRGFFAPGPRGLAVITRAPQPGRRSPPARHLEVWRADTGTSVVGVPDVTPIRAAWSPNGAVVALGTTTGAVTLVDAASGKALATIEVDAGPIAGLAFDGVRRLLVTTAVGGIRLVDIASGAITDPGVGHTGPVDVVGFAGDRVVTAGDRTVRVWGLDGREQQRLALDEWGVVAALDSGLDVVAACASGGVFTVAKVWQLDGSPVGSHDLQTTCSALGVTPTGELLGAELGVLWHAGADGYEVVRDVPDSAFAEDVDIDHHRAVFVDRGVARVYRDGDEEHRLVVPACDPYGEAALSPDGKRIATTDLDAVYLWDLAKATMIASIALEEEGAYDIAFDPRSERLAFASSSAIVLWTPSTGAATALELDFSVASLAFDADGGRLAVGLDDGRLAVWSTAELARRAVATPTKDVPPPLECPNDGQELETQGNEEDSYDGDEGDGPHDEGEGEDEGEGVFGE